MRRMFLDSSVILRTFESMVTVAYKNEAMTSLSSAIY